MTSVNLGLTYSITPLSLVIVTMLRLCSTAQKSLCSSSSLRRLSVMEFYPDTSAVLRCIPVQQLLFLDVFG